MPSLVRSRARLVAVLALAATSAGPIGCTLDFDRYDPADASPTPGGDASTVPDASRDAAAPPQDASPESGPDAADASADGEGGCAALPGCLGQATSCGASCGQDYSTCGLGCDAQPCMDTCRSAEQSCLGRCISTCIACTTDGGCPASNQCLGASTP